MSAAIVHFFYSNAYFATTLFYLVPVIAGFFLFPALQRKIVFLSGLASAPVFPFLIFLEGAYWSPQRLGGLTLGIEDALCSFAVGSMALAVAILPFQRRITITIHTKTAWYRYFVLGGAIAGAFLLLYITGTPPMTALILSTFLGWMILIVVRKDLWVLSFFGMVAFAVVHTVIMKTGLLIWSEFLRHYNIDSFWGRPVYGVPLGETVWALVYGAGWPLFVSYFLDIRLKTKRNH